MKHTSGNQVNILIKLCVHPNIIPKSTKAWIIRSFRVVTWLGYKRKDICGIIEFKWPSIGEHFFYLHSKINLQDSPYIKHKPLVINHIYLDLDNLFYFGLFLSFLLFLFFFFFFMYIFFFSFSFVFTQQCCLDQNSNSPIHMTIKLHLPFLSNLLKT